MRRNRSIRVLTGLLTALALAVPALANANTGITRSVVDAAGGVYWRTEAPDWANPIRNAGYGVYDGDQIELICWELGTTVPPRWNNTLWYRARIVSGIGKGEGFVNDHFIDTGVNQPNIVVPGVPDCSNSGGTTHDAEPETVPYNRSAAVSWALAHAQDEQARTAMCTWFVSNALWAGGLPKTSEWTDQGHYSYTAQGTAAAWLVSDFLNYIRGNYSTTWIDITDGFRTNAVPEAEPGDIIAYDWGEGDGVSHLSFVVNIASGQYPEVAEMGQFNFNLVQAGMNKIKQVRSPYVKRGWTWSEMHQRWLQEGSPNIRAYLLHFNGGAYVSNF